MEYQPTDNIHLLKQQLTEQDRVILAQRESLEEREREIDRLRAQLDKLKRMNFGRRSEKVAHQIEQFEQDLKKREKERIACCRFMSPLETALRRYVLMSGKLHADDTPVPVLLPGNKKAKTGRLWVYERDDRNACSSQPPAVWFAYSPDRKGIHPQSHLVLFSGVLQADAYAGFNELYDPEREVAFKRTVAVEYHPLD